MLCLALGRTYTLVTLPERLIFHFRGEIPIIPRLLKKKHFLQGQFLKKQHFPAFSSFLPAGRDVERKETLDYLSLHDGPVERKQNFGKIGWVFFHVRTSPSRFPHFFSFHVFTLSPAQSISHISFVSSFPPSSAQAIFHTSFLYFPSFLGGGGGGYRWQKYGKERYVGKMAGLSSTFSPARPSRPSCYPHFFFFPRFHPSSSPGHFPQSFISAFPPSGQAIFHISFLLFPSSLETLLGKATLSLNAGKQANCVSLIVLQSLDSMSFHRPTWHSSTYGSHKFRFLQAAVTFWSWELACCLVPCNGGHLGVLAGRSERPFGRASICSIW